VFFVTIHLQSPARLFSRAEWTFEKRKGRKRDERSLVIPLAVELLALIFS